MIGIESNDRVKKIREYILYKLQLKYKLCKCIYRNKFKCQMYNWKLTIKWKKKIVISGFFIFCDLKIIFCLFVPPFYFYIAFNLFISLFFLTFFLISSFLLFNLLKTLLLPSCNPIVKYQPLVLIKHIAITNYYCTKLSKTFF